MWVLTGIALVRQFQLVPSILNDKNLTVRTHTIHFCATIRKKKTILNIFLSAESLHEMNLFKEKKGWLATVEMDGVLLRKIRSFMKIGKKSEAIKCLIIISVLNLKPLHITICNKGLSFLSFNQHNT